MSHQIISQTKTNGNGNTAAFVEAFLPKTDNRILLKLTRPCRTTQLGFILDAGTVGRVVSLAEGSDGHYCYLVEFADLPTIITVPFDSPLIEIMRGQK